MDPKKILADARTLEEAFFAKDNARLLEQMREKKQREELREVVQIKDEAFLDRLIELGINPETVLALTLVPPPHRPQRREARESFAEPLHAAAFMIDADEQPR